MIRFDETPTGPSRGQAILSALMQGMSQYNSLKRWREDKAKEDEDTKIKNILAIGEGEVDDQTAQALMDRGLGARLSPVQGAVAGQKRFKLVPTPKQRMDDAIAQKQLAGLERTEENDRKDEAIRTFLGQQHGLTPDVQMQAYMRAGRPAPKELMDLVNQMQAQQNAAERYRQMLEMLGMRQGFTAEQNKMYRNPAMAVDLFKK